MMEYKTLTAIAAGGFAGALSRYGLSQVGMNWGGFPLNTLVINILGAFLLAGFLEISLDRLRVSGPVRTGVSTGFLGAFTTFSGLCAEAFSLNTALGTGAAGAYVAISLAGGLIATVLGIAGARFLMGSSGEAHG